MRNQFLVVKTISLRLLQPECTTNSSVLSAFGPNQKGLQWTNIRCNSPPLQSDFSLLLATINVKVFFFSCVLLRLSSAETRGPACTVTLLQVASAAGRRRLARLPLHGVFWLPRWGPLWLGNQLHSSSLWTLRIPQMNMATHGYSVSFSVLHHLSAKLRWNLWA